MYKINVVALFLILVLGCLIFAYRAYFALADYFADDVTNLLGFPLAVVLPAAAFFFLASRRSIKSSEGVLMQLGTMILLLLIVALPRLSLHLALGLPVVFLVVELFEQHAPDGLRRPIKAVLVA